MSTYLHVTVPVSMSRLGDVIYLKFFTSLFTRKKRFILRVESFLFRIYLHGTLLRYVLSKDVTKRHPMRVFDEGHALEAKKLKSTLKHDQNMLMNESIVE